MLLDLLPEVTVSPVTRTLSGVWVPHRQRPLRIRAGVYPVAPEVVEWQRLEPENRPPLPGPVLISREDAEQVAALEGQFVRLEAEELGALSGYVFAVQGLQADATWAAWSLEALLEAPLEQQLPAVPRGTPGRRREWFRQWARRNAERLRGMPQPSGR